MGQFIFLARLNERDLSGKRSGKKIGSPRIQIGEHSGADYFHAVTGVISPAHQILRSLGDGVGTRRTHRVLLADWYFLRLDLAINLRGAANLDHWV